MLVKKFTDASGGLRTGGDIVAKLAQVKKAKGMEDSIAAKLWLLPVVSTAKGSRFLSENNVSVGVQCAVDCRCENVLSAVIQGVNNCAAAAVRKLGYTYTAGEFHPGGSFVCAYEEPRDAVHLLFAVRASMDPNADHSGMLESVEALCDRADILGNTVSRSLARGVENAYGLGDNIRQVGELEFFLGRMGGQDVVLEAAGLSAPVGELRIKLKPSTHPAFHAMYHELADA